MIGSLMTGTVSMLIGFIVIRVLNGQRVRIDERDFVTPVVPGKNNVKHTAVTETIFILQLTNYFKIELNVKSADST